MNFDFFAGDVTLFAASTSVTNPTGVIGTLDCGGLCDALFLGIVDTTTPFMSASVQFGPNAGTPFGPFSFELDNLTYTTLASPVPVPEPGTLGLFLTGLIGLGLISRRRRQPKA